MLYFITTNRIKITGNLFLRKTGRQNPAPIYTSEKPEMKNKLQFLLPKNRR
jgi:hypothetical protein